MADESRITYAETMNEVKPLVIVSKCLGFAACRYNGQNLKQEAVEQMKPFINFHPLCPEAEIGLGIPRDPIRLVRIEEQTALYQPATGQNITDRMTDYIQKKRKELTALNPDGFLLKAKSPSCGLGSAKLYPSTAANPGSPTRTSGLFAAMLEETLPELPREDEGRLRNFTYREHFLTALFCRARFRQAASSGDMGSLVDFHTRYKLLFLACNQASVRRLGKLTANHENLAFPDVIAAYSRELARLLEKPPKPGSLINALQHAFSRMSAHLTPQERQFFVNTCEEYRDERVPLSVPLHILKGWALRLKNSYLLNQYLLEPFPQELTNITDSGLGRQYRK